MLESSLIEEEPLEHIWFLSCKWHREMVQSEYMGFEITRICLVRRHEKIKNLLKELMVFTFSKNGGSGMEVVFIFYAL